MKFELPSVENKVIQPNNNDLAGNIWYSKSINLDEEGYIKLSHRTVSIANEETSGFVGQSLAFGRYSDGQFFIVTDDEPVKATVSESSVSVTEDTDSNNPALTIDSWGTWWRNRWYVTDTNDLLWKNPSTGAWNDAGLSLTSGVCHPIEVFQNRTTLCIGDGNQVQQFTAADGADTTLVLPSTFEVTAMAYSNNKMGIVTKLSDDADSQNGEAFFFIWDGATASANNGYPVGSDSIYAITAYKSSWVLLTRTGQLLYWNGGAFQELASLPFYYLNLTWGDPVNKQIFGNALQVEGDLIYINMNNEFNRFGTRYEMFAQNCPSGVLCFDPKIGLYHRYAPSISSANLITVTDANVSTSTNTLTKTAGTLPETGNPIKYVSSYIDQIGGLTVGRVYYIIRDTSTQFKLAETKQDAIDGNAIDITSDGSSNNYFLALDLVDYGASRAARTGAVALFGEANQVADHAIFGGEYLDKNSTTDYYHINISVAGFKNIGYFVTPKLAAELIEETQQQVLIKYRPLKEGDRIIIKSKDLDVLGIPVTTPQGALTCSWTSSTVLTTTADLSDVKTYLDADSTRQCEVEITSGAGAGQMSQIASITYNVGTYTVTLADAIEGGASGNTCDIIVDNWKTLETITSTDTAGYKEISPNTSAKWTKYKVILEGDETTIEKFRVSTTPHK